MREYAQLQHDYDNDEHVRAAVNTLEEVRTELIEEQAENERLTDEINDLEEQLAVAKERIDWLERKLEEPSES